MKQQMKLALLGGALLGLVACGGGGGSGSPSGADSMISQKPEISPELAAQIKVEKVISTATSEVGDKPVTNSKFIILGKNFGLNDVELDLFPKYKLVREVWNESYESENDKYREEGFWRVYNQDYSAVVAETQTLHLLNDKRQLEDPYRQFGVEDIVGLRTSAKELPTKGNITYKGVAFDFDQQGSLIYHVDFANKQGFGEITGLEKFGKITLESGGIGNLIQSSLDAKDIFDEPEIGITSTAKSEKNDEFTATEGFQVTRVVKGYDLQFFGPNAVEIGGVVKTEENIHSNPRKDLDAPIGFAGTKQ